LAGRIVVLGGLPCPANAVININVLKL